MLTMDDYQAAFDRIDTDHSGYIEISEIKQLFVDAYGGHEQDIPIYEITAFLNFFDSNEVCILPTEANFFFVLLWPSRISGLKLSVFRFDSLSFRSNSYSRSTFFFPCGLVHCPQYHVPPFHLGTPIETKYRMEKYVGRIFKKD